MLPNRVARLLLMALAAVLLSACGVHTRAAVRNETGKTIEVSLKSADGDDTVSYGTIPTGTTSAFEKLGFSSWADVVVTIAGDDTARTVTLEPEKDNTVVVTPDAATTEAEYNPENEWW